jgi:hypothetical protein
MQLIYLFYQQVLCLARCNEQSCPSTGGAILVEFVVVFFQDVLRCMFVIWRIWFLKKIKLFRQFLVENFGDLVMSVCISTFG